MRIKTQTLVTTKVPTLVPVVGGGPAPEVDNLLLESGDDFLLEAGGYILLEGGAPPLVTSGLMVNYDFSNPACYTTNAFNDIYDLSGNVINARGSATSAQFYYNAADYGGAFVFAPTSDPGNAESKIDLNDGMGIPPYTAAPYFNSNPTGTFDFWVKINSSLPRNAALIGNHIGSGDGRFTIYATPGPNYRIAVVKSDVVVTAIFNGYLYTPDVPINITVTKTGFTYQLYMNGQFKTTIVDGGSNTYNIGGHCLGQSFINANPIGQKSLNKFRGSMYTFLCYNRVLTAAEIQQNFDHRKSRFGL